MNILFICTSNKDRSPALQKYFEIAFPNHKYMSAGVNKFFTQKYNTNYVGAPFLDCDPIDWADFFVFAEKIHHHILLRDHHKAGVKLAAHIDNWLILDAGEFNPQNPDEYLLRADEKLHKILSQNK